MEAQREISARKNDQLVGSTIKVMVEREVEGEFVCRSERDAPEVDGEVYVTSKTPLAAGDFVDVEITGSLDYDLFGENKGPATLHSQPWKEILPILG